MEEMYEQISLFEDVLPSFKLKEPVILLEMFAGIGAQRKSLEILGIKIDDKQSKICEWAFNSYLAYNAIHIKDKTDYSNGKTKDELIARINGTSTNYNEPLTKKQLERKPMEWLKAAYNNCIATHNLINIMEVKGRDLGELPSNQTSILTYSFPCQDLSLAGKRQGMETSQKDGGTRSGLLWEVERIIRERVREHSNLPTILLMENVPEVIGSGNIEHFKKWEQQLREFGYSNFVEIMNGKDYGIPQNRKRCFMISILGEYTYSFPCKMPLKYRLKDLLEKNVDEKFYLDDATIERISNWKAQQKPLENMSNNVVVSPTLTARGAGEDHSGMILIDTQLFEDGEVVDYDSSDEFRREHSTEESPSLLTKPKLAVVEKDKDETDGGGLKIRNATKQGYIKAEDGDGVDISTRMETHRGTVQKGTCQTLTCKGGENVGVVIDEELKE